MNVSNELQVAQAAEESVVRALRATQTNDATTGPPRHSEQTDQCPKLDRFVAVRRFGGSWTAEEADHIASGCPFCQKVFAMFFEAENADTQEDLPDTDAGEVAENTVFEANEAEETKIEKPRTPGVSEDTKLG